MKAGPYRVRLGHLNERKQEVDWLDELNRFQSINHRYRSCSFYVPVLTPVVLAVKQDPADLEADPKLKRPFRVTVTAGSTRFSEDIAEDDIHIHMYGGNINSTGLKGKDVPLIASEENIEVVITDLEGARDLATFEYKHLQCDAMPEHFDLSRIKYSEVHAPLPYSAASTSNSKNKVLKQQDQDYSEEEEDELVDSDGDVVIAYTGVNHREVKQPTTPISKMTTTSTSLTPHFKALGRASTIKAEQLELQLSPSKPPTPANLVKKETERKIEALQRELQLLKDQTRSLGSAHEKKQMKAKAAFDRAIVRAQQEHDSTLRKNTDMIEELESQLKEQAKTLKWIRDAIFASAKEVIELSDDSDSDSDLEEDDEEESSPSTSTQASPHNIASADPFA